MTQNNMTVLITGAAGGLGKTYAKRFAKAGYNVVICDIQDEMGQNTAAEISEYGVCKYIHADVSKQDDLVNLVDQTMDLFGGIHVLINNAVVVLRLRPEQIKQENWEYEVGINQKAVFFLTQLVAKIMKRQHYGKIINVASPRSQFADNRHILYGMTKKAVIALTEYFGVSLARYGINVNAVSLGMILTPMSEHHLQDPRFIEKCAVFHPINRLITQDEAANVVLFLASDASIGIVGQTIIVDGGFSVFNQAEAPTMQWPEDEIYEVNKY
jgi:NAD(P)-dependent dehydrogenase (short-subunit alcohol dehydrogenase family)